MSDINIYKLFPVPVFEKKLDNHEELNKELEKYIYNLKENPSGLVKSNAGGWHSPFFNMKIPLLLKNLFQALIFFYKKL